MIRMRLSLIGRIVAAILAVALLGFYVLGHFGRHL
jgi:hypothetical protein